MKRTEIEIVRSCIEATAERNCFGDKEIKNFMIEQLIADFISFYNFVQADQKRYFLSNLNKEIDIDLQIASSYEEPIEC